ncbi:MAG: MFS transporter [Anaerolineae bacterium]|nr:MFS transporter [Anaerolineae bacterium]
MTHFAAAQPPRTAAEEAAYKRRWIALLILSLSLTLIVMDSTIVNIAFPSIRATFGASFADAEWVNSIYSLIFGAALITWGKLGDQYGRRNIFIAGAIVFLIGSLGSGLAATIPVMILFRGVQGMGGAMMSPSTLSIISGMFKGRERGIAFGIWGATAGVAAALGPILGGWLITYGGATDSWRLAFLINVPIGIVAIAGSFWAIREQRDTSIKHHIDWLGIVLASLALGAVVFGAIEGQTYGWLEAKKVFTLGSFVYPQVGADGVIAAGTTSFIPFVFIFAIVMFVLFIIVETQQERRKGEPLFEFGMFRYPSFRYGLITVAIVALGEFGAILVLSIFFQLAKSLNAFETGLTFLPLALAMIVAAPTAGALSTRFGAKWVVTTGMICEALALFIIASLFNVDTPIWQLMLAFTLYGVGVGLAIAQLANIVLSDVPPEKAGVASGANNTIRQIGAALGIAVIGAVLFGNFATAAKPLVEQTTAFKDFVTWAADNPDLSKESKVIAAQFGAFEDTAKKSIETGLDNNEGFDSNTDVLDTALANIPGAAKLALKLTQGVDLDNPEVVTKIKTELKPGVDQLQAGIQRALAIGFSQGAHDATTVAAVFVALGALSSFMLPQTKIVPRGDSAPVMAH